VTHSAWARYVRPSGAALLDVFLAVIGTQIVQSPFERFTKVSSLGQSLLIEDLITSAAAFGLGCSFFRWLRPATSKWIWIAGLCWFGQRVLFPPDGNHVVFWEISATRSVFPDLQALNNWATYTLPCLRTCFYSAGALCCSRLLGRSEYQDTGAATEEHVDRRDVSVPGGS